MNNEHAAQALAQAGIPFGRAIDGNGLLITPLGEDEGTPFVRATSDSDGTFHALICEDTHTGKWDQQQETLTDNPEVFVGEVLEFVTALHVDEFHTNSVQFTDRIS